MARRVLMAIVSGGLVRGRPRLGRKNGPYAYVNEFNAAIFVWPVFFRTALPFSGGYHL